MWASLLVAALSAGLACAAVPPDSYDRWTAEEKVSWWKDNLDVGRGGSEDTANWGAECTQDCMKPECIHPGGFNTRKDVVNKYECKMKGLHPTGIVAWVKAVWDDNKYTGMFQKSDYGFVRWGFQFYDEKMTEQVKNGYAYTHNITQKPMDEKMNWTDHDCFEYDCFNLSRGYIFDQGALPDDLKPTKAQFMALKFFRDSVPSAAIHLGFNGFPTWNHLSKNYTNLLMNFEEEANDTTPGSFSEQGAERGTKWPGFTGLHDMAMFDQEGKLQHNIRFPYQIIFMARSLQAIPESPHGNYKETVSFTEELQPGTTLYDIYVKDTFASKMVKIGRLDLTSKIMVSADTDRQVFFYHPRYDRDLILRPDLSKGHRCKTWWFCPVCPAIEEFCHPNWFELMWHDHKQNQYLKKHKNLKAAKRPNTTSVVSVLGAESTKDRLLPRNWGNRRPPPVSCGYARSSRAAAVPMQLPSSRKVGRLRGGAELQTDSTTSDPAESSDMREDDVTVEPRSGLRHSSKWFCDGDTPEWPQGPRKAPWVSSCTAKLVRGRPVAEPEYALDEACQDIPKCNKADGTWYSGTYPCRCGESKCQTGELCFAHDSSCVPWGPFARTSKRSVV